MKNKNKTEKKCKIQEKLPGRKNPGKILGEIQEKLHGGGTSRKIAICQTILVIFDMLTNPGHFRHVEQSRSFSVR